MSAGFACHLVQIVGVLCLICSLFLPSSGLCARCLCFFLRGALLCASGFDFVWQAFQWPSMGSHCRLGSRWFASVDVCVYVRSGRFPSSTLTVMCATFALQLRSFSFRRVQALAWCRGLLGRRCPDLCHTGK